MSRQRIVGVALVVLGVVLLIVGIARSDRAVARLSESFPGPLAEPATWCVVGGLGLALLGGPLALDRGGTGRESPTSVSMVPVDSAVRPSGRTGATPPAPSCGF
jgi:hypothetical protein